MPDEQKSRSAAASSAAPTRKQSRGDRTRDRILKAAVAEFSRGGYDKTTTREIARRAGVNHGLINYHFHGKDELWQASIDQLFARANVSLPTLEQPVDPRQVRVYLRALLHTYVVFGATHPELYRFVLQSCWSDPERLRWLIERHARTYFNFAVDLVATAQRAGVLPEGDPAQIHYQMFGAASMVVQQPIFEALTGRTKTREELIESTSALLDKLFLGPDPD